jgi:hypothetical protein
MHWTFPGVAVALVVLAAGAAQAETLKYSAKLDGADEVPANDTKGTGEVSASLDTSSKVFTYKANYSGLTGPAMAAHFHGPAAAGANAPPIVMVKPVDNPISGKATLTDAQVADLKAGKWYFNIHTTAHPGGEIRGQLSQAQ